MNDLLKYLPIAIVLLVYAARMKEVATKRDVIQGPVQEKLTFRLFMISGLIVLVGGIAEYIWRGLVPNWWLVGVGVVLAVASFAIRRAAIAALGKFWSLHVEMRDNHEFVTSGPFKYVRHPTYFSMILELSSVALILVAPFAAIVAFIVFIPALRLRLRLEEKALIKKFGPNYLEYTKRTPAVIPIPGL